MNRLNVVVLTGNLGKDVEVKRTKSGKSFCYFSVATDGEFDTVQKREGTTWVECEAWESVAEYFGKYGRRGAFVELKGRLKTVYRGEGEKKVPVTVIKVDINGSHITQRKGGTSPTGGVEEIDGQYSEKRVQIDDDALPF